MFKRIIEENERRSELRVREGEHGALSFTATFPVAAAFGNVCNWSPSSSQKSFVEQANKQKNEVWYRHPVHQASKHHHHRIQNPRSHFTLFTWHIPLFAQAKQLMELVALEK